MTCHLTLIRRCRRQWWGDAVSSWNCSGFHPSSSSSVCKQQTTSSDIHRPARPTCRRRYGQDIAIFDSLLETTQAMLWLSCKSIIQKKWQYWNFSIGAKSQQVLFLSTGNVRITPIHFWLLPLHGAMNHSGTPLWLMLRSPSFYQGANC